MPKRFPTDALTNAGDPGTVVDGQLWFNSSTNKVRVQIAAATQSLATEAYVDTGVATRIANTLVNAKGDLITATADDTPAQLTVGSNGQFLVADSAATNGIKWATQNIGMLPTFTSGWWYPVGGPPDAAPTGANPATNRVYAVPMIMGKDGTINGIAINCSAVTTSNGVAVLGIYQDNGSGIPGARLYTSGSLSTSATGVKSATPSVAVLAGQLIWLAAGFAITTGSHTFTTQTSQNLCVRGTNTTIAQADFTNYVGAGGPGCYYDDATVVSSVPDPFSVDGMVNPYPRIMIKFA